MQKRTRTIMLFITIMIAVMTVASSCLEFIRPGREFDALDLVDELAEESSQDDQQADDKDDGEDTEEDQGAWYQPQVPFSDFFNTPGLYSLDWAFNMVYPTATNDERAKVVFTVDPNTGKLIYSIEGQAPGLYLPQVDQVGWGSFMLHYFGNWSGPSPDVVFPCDQDINALPPEQDWFTICPDGAGVSNGMNWYVVYTIFDAPILWGDMDYSYTYAAVFDADGIPDNNFQYMDPYNWDFWQNTDQWYILDWMQEPQTWTVSVLGENWEPVQSNSRAVVHDNALFWFIPEGEFSVSQPGFRLSSFATPGGWDPADVGGDVNGENPTEPLTPFGSNEILVVDPLYTEASVVLDDEWEICGSGVCKYNEKIVEAQKTEVWCTDDGCTDLGGECSLFSRDKDESPQDPASWTYVAGSNEKMQKDWSLAYHCFCVK